MSVIVICAAGLPPLAYEDAVTFSIDHGALLLYDRDMTGLTRLVRAFAVGEWERVWLDGGET